MSKFVRYFRIPGIALPVFLAAGLLHAARVYPAAPGQEVRPDELIVRLSPGATIDQILRSLPGNGNTAQPLRAAQRLYLIHNTPGMIGTVISSLARNSQVDYVEPNRVRHTSVAPPADPSYSAQWALKTVQAVNAWTTFPNAYLTSASPEAGRIRVAVLDTGTDCTHPDFVNSGGASTDAAAGGQLSFGSSEALVATTLSSPACPWQDDFGHGTHVAGIIAAATNNAVGVAGLAYPVEVVSYKVLNNSGAGTDGTPGRTLPRTIDAACKAAVDAANRPGQSCAAAAGSEAGTPGALVN